MPATDADIIRWQLKCLKEVASKLTERELELLISFEGQFDRKGTLSSQPGGQMEVLENIYKRRT
jgi:hypothetical protein